MNNICYGFLKIWNIVDFRDHFPKKSIFSNFRGQKPKILKNRDSHLVELLILRLLVFSICVFITKLRLPQTREVWSIFDQKWRVVTSQNRPYLKKIPTDFKKKNHGRCQIVVWEGLPSFTSIALFVFELSRIFGRGRLNAPPPRSSAG